MVLGTVKKGRKEEQWKLKTLTRYFYYIFIHIMEIPRRLFSPQLNLFSLGFFYTKYKLHKQCSEVEKSFTTHDYRVDNVHEKANGVGIGTRGGGEIPVMRQNLIDLLKYRPNVDRDRRISGVNGNSHFGHPSDLSLRIVAYVTRKLLEKSQQNTLA